MGGSTGRQPRSNLDQGPGSRPSARRGLGNHCWRDSWDGVQFSDGTIPPLPIATCENQGYTYDAKLRMAELADGPLADPGLAQRLRSQAQELRKRLNQDFWIERRGGYYAIGLDGDKRQIDTMTSNMGQLLWSGIVPPDRADIIVRHLVSPDMFSDWGIRTTSKMDAAYNPIGYHMGTVWPHDNSLIAYGLARYGYRQEANRIIVAMIEAASYSGNRLPEAFSGYERSSGRVPVPYPTACSPQAWASGAPLLFLRTMPGMEASGRIEIDADVPPEFGRVRLAGTNAFGKRWDVSGGLRPDPANSRRGHVRDDLTIPAVIPMSLLGFRAAAGRGGFRCCTARRVVIFISVVGCGTRPPTDAAQPPP